MLSYQDSPECMMEKLLQANVETNSPWPDCEKHIHSRQKTSFGNRNKKYHKEYQKHPRNTAGRIGKKLGSLPDLQIVGVTILPANAIEVLV